MMDYRSTSSGMALFLLRTMSSLYEEKKLHVY